MLMPDNEKFPANDKLSRIRELFQDLSAEEKVQLAADLAQDSDIMSALIEFMLSNEETASGLLSLVADDESLMATLLGILAERQQSREEAEQDVRGTYVDFLKRVRE